MRKVLDSIRSRRDTMPGSSISKRGNCRPRGVDQNKDQTYFLCQMGKEALRHTLFPIGDLTKPQVRVIAEELKLDSVSRKKDSTGICFIGERDFRAFLQNYLPAKRGRSSTLRMAVRSGHCGVLYYTIGQRKGPSASAETWGPGSSSARCRAEHSCLQSG